ncbi:MAG: hypothetical protein KDE08_00720 [Rhodobacteraceae bacterium]|nr:hypothetical protein [Paracoccaceae bacterium]
MAYRFLAALLFFAVTSATAPSAGATTVTFDNVPDYGTALDEVFNTGSQTPYVENGVTVTPTDGLLAWEFTQGAAHMDDSGTDFTSGLMFTMANTFDAVSFSLISLGYGFWDTPGPLNENIFVTGFSGGSIVAFAEFVLSDVFLDPQTFLLGAGFSALDALLIQIVDPANSAACDAPCGHFDLDTVVLAPIIPTVPVPPSVAMMTIAGGLLFAVGRRRKARLTARA